MSYRKSEDTPAKKRRRLPFKAVIERDEVFRLADRDELDAECRRLTNGAEFYYSMDRFGDHYWHVVRFGSQHQAEALDLWLRRNRFAERPAPKFGPSPEEKTAFEQAALVWGLRTGAVRRIVQAFRNTSGSLTQQWSAAESVAHSYRMPEGNVAQVLVSWAMKHHYHWFFRERRPALLLLENPDDYPPPNAYPHSEEC